MPVRWGRITDVAIATAFIGLMLVQIARHQMWRDELNAWGLVLASHTLPYLFHNLHYEGHPGLWHLLLWCASWFSRSTAAMQIVHATIAVGFILLVVFASPFSRVEKVLLLLNFYLVFEYAVVSRNYGLGVLLALIYAHLRVTHPERTTLNAAVLGLLANTNVYATLLSGALASEAVADRLLVEQWNLWRTARRLAPAAAVYLAFVVLCAATIKPAPDISWRTTAYPLKHAFDLDQLRQVVLGYLGTGLVPTMRRFAYAPSLDEQMLGLALVALLWGIVAWIFRHDWRALLVVGLTALAAVTFGQLIYPGWIRHWGIVFVAFTVALWLHRARDPRWSCPALAVLAFGAVTGVQEVRREATWPYSMAEPTAAWLRQNEPLNTMLIGSPDSATAGVAIMLDQPMYFLDCRCTDTYLRFMRRRDGYTLAQLPERLDAAMQTVGTRPAILVTDVAFSGEMMAALRARHIALKPLAAFVGAYIEGEDFYLYDVTTQAR